MGRNYHCIEEEKKVVKIMKDHSKSLREIEEILGRSLYFVQNA